MSKDRKGITCGMEPWSIRQFCGVPAVSVSMQHRVDRSLQVKARVLVTVNRIAAGGMFDANLARRRRRHSPGLAHGRPKGRHLRGIGPAKPDVGCASGPDVRVPESGNRLSMSNEIEENEMSPAALGLLSTGTRRQPWPPRSLIASFGWFVPTSPPGPAKAKRNPELLADFLITKELRPKIRSLAIRIWTRCAGSYTAVGRAIEERSGVMASPTTGMKRMGHGRVLFTVGSWSFFRDVHRFGFETFRKLSDAGTKLVDDATAAIADVARA
ncbi:DUF269 domain-containing protein [Mesorhizobium sp.]|uniref:DUF269 domain-containing protein n=1 Tax=Mesorhizobium sp. TaxID=1871066 RepID=UPI00257B7EC8|nr:DUF269 domain-containing protein [Mesorhizobium sp.]